MESECVGRFNPSIQGAFVFWLKQQSSFLQQMFIKNDDIIILASKHIISQFVTLYAIVKYRKLFLVHSTFMILKEGAYI